MHRNVSKIALAVAVTLVACIGWPAAAQNIDTLQPPVPSTSRLAPGSCWISVHR